MNVHVSAAYCAPQMLIAGDWIGASAREFIAVEDPSTRTEIGAVPCATMADLDRALDAAWEGFKLWRATPAATRQAVLRSAATLLRQRAESIGIDMTLENGKPLHESVDEVMFSADIVDFLADQAVRLDGKVLPTVSGRTTVTYEPVGPVAAFTTWNYPLTVPARKIAGALAAGCSVVIKPAEECPASASAVAFARALVDAGLPAGVLNVVFGDPAMISEHLIASPRIRKVSFTGSGGVGRHIAGLAAKALKPAMLELGGHNPVLVFDDVDVDGVVGQAVGSKFHNGGQSCGSPARFLIDARIKDEFVAKFIERTRQLSVAPGLDDGDIGALANGRRRESMIELVDDAVRCGATLAYQGEPQHRDGYFWGPAVLVDVPLTARIMSEEPFGPIAVINSFTSEAEAVAEANRLPYGLGAYAFTSSLDRATRVTSALEAGMIGLNRFGLGGVDTFFGGVKMSGYGSEGGPEAVTEYLVPKLTMQA